MERVGRFCYDPERCPYPTWLHTWYVMTLDQPTRHYHQTLGWGLRRKWRRGAKRRASLKAGVLFLVTVGAGLAAIWKATK
jgi:hypothetical protein